MFLGSDYFVKNSNQNKSSSVKRAKNKEKRGKESLIVIMLDIHIMCYILFIAKGYLLIDNIGR